MKIQHIGFIRRWLLRMTAVALGCTGLSLPAATRIWSGSDLSGHWNLAANWGGAGIPTDGDDLVFPSDVPSARRTSTNNLAGIQVRTVTFAGTGGGYVVRGEALGVSEAVIAQQSSGTNSLAVDIVLEGDVDFEVSQSSGGLDVVGNVDLQDRNLRVHNTGFLQLNGVVSGTGGVRKSGTGTLAFGGRAANTYAGATIVTGGLLTLGKQALVSRIPPVLEGVVSVPGDLVVGDFRVSDTVRLLADDQIADTSQITVDLTGLLDLNGHEDAVGDLVLQGGNVTTGTGRLILTDDVSFLSSGSRSLISGALFLSPGSHIFHVADGSDFSDLRIDAIISGGVLGSLVKEGSGELELGGANLYAGNTIINDGMIRLTSHTGLGSTARGTIVNGTGRLLLINQDVVGESLTINDHNSQTSSLGSTAVSSSWSGPITVNDQARILAIGELTLSGPMTGPGGLILGGDPLILTGDAANTYEGDTWIQGGTLILDKAALDGAVPGQLIVGDNDFSSATVQWMRSSQMAFADVIINRGSILDLHGFNDGIGGVRLRGGTIDTGDGLLTLSGDLAAEASDRLANIHGRLSLGALPRVITVADNPVVPDLRITARITGSGSLRKDGAGELLLTGLNTYLGTTFVDRGTLSVVSSAGLGAAQNGTVLGDARLHLGGANIQNETLTVKHSNARLTATITNVWGGSIVLEDDLEIGVDPGLLDIPGAITGFGELTKTGAGSLVFSGSDPNTYQGATVVAEGKLRLEKVVAESGVPGDLVIGDGEGGPESDIVEVLFRGQIADASDVTVASSGFLHIVTLNEPERIGSLAGDGAVELGVFSRLEIGANDRGTIYRGTLRGGGELRKVGQGSFTLNADSAFQGPTFVDSGTFNLNGRMEQSDFLVAGSASLSGRGTVRGLVAERSATVAPGDFLGNIGSKDLALQSGSRLVVELFGAETGVSHDSLSAEETVQLSGAELEVVLGYAPLENQPHIIIAHHGEDPISGEFFRLPEGGILSSGGYDFVVSYTGGTGNDVTLTATNMALAAASVAIRGGNGDGALDFSECNLLEVVVSNRFDTPLTEVRAVVGSQSYGTAVTVAESTYPDVGAFGLATNVTPFQLRTLENLPCDRPVTLSVILTSRELPPIGFLMDLPAPSDCEFGGGGCASCQAPFMGAMSETSLRLNRFLNSKSGTSVCGVPHVCLKVSKAFSGPGLRYQTHTITNDGPETCVTVVLSELCDAAPAELYAAAYLDTFDPAEPCAGMIGEVGDNAEGPPPYGFSFSLPAFSRAVLVVQEAEVDLPCTDYAMEVFGLPCASPQLTIGRTDQPDRVRLSWPTSAGGFRLESAPDMQGQPGMFRPVPQSPVVSEGVFAVTNLLQGGHEFFRLQRP